MTYKAISLLQPWASLVVMGAKRLETRSWNTKYRGPLLIHASVGKKYGKPAISCRELCYHPTFGKFINGVQYDELPFGAIIGEVQLVYTDHTEALLEQSEIIIQNMTWGMTVQEMRFGDYTPKRYGWLLKNPIQFKNPIPCKGSLSIWEAPNDLNERIMQELQQGNHVYKNNLLQ